MGLRGIQGGVLPGREGGDRSAKEGWGGMEAMGKIREGQEKYNEGKEYLVLFETPQKPSPCFLTTPPKKEDPFFRQLVKRNQLKKIKLVQK